MTCPISNINIYDALFWLFTARYAFRGPSSSLLVASSCGVSRLGLFPLEALNLLLVSASLCIESVATDALDLSVTSNNFTKISFPNFGVKPIFLP